MGSVGETQLGLVFQILWPLNNAKDYIFKHSIYAWKCVILKCSILFYKKELVGTLIPKAVTNIHFCCKKYWTEGVHNFVTIFSCSSLISITIEKQQKSMLLSLYYYIHYICLLALLFAYYLEYKMLLLVMMTENSHISFVLIVMVMCKKLISVVCTFIASPPFYLAHSLN